MVSLFSPAADTKLRVALIVIGCGLVGAPVILMAWVRTPYVREQSDPLQQPVQFDHRHHYQDDGIDCRYCHHLAERAASAGVPSTALCMGCHAQIWNQSPNLQPVRRSYYEDEPIEWRRVHRLGDFAYFTHRAHVTRGVGCVTCHGHVERMPVVYRVAPLTMGWCLDCHRDPAPHLRPLDQITNMGWRPEEPRAALGQRLMAEMNIDPPTHCTACHR